MTDECRNDRLSSRWIILGCVLAFSIFYSLTDRIRLNFEPGYFLPLLTAWLASRAGGRVFLYLLLFGILAAFGVRFRMDEIGLSLGFSREAYFVSVLAACAFVRPRIGELLAGWLRPGWRWVLWAVLCVLAVVGFLRLGWHFEIKDTLRSTWGGGGVVVLLAALALVRWPKLAARLGPIRQSLLRHPFRNSSVTICVCLLVAGLFVVIRFAGIGAAGISFGFSNSWYWLTVGCFAATAFNLLDWRALIGVLLIVFTAEWVCTTFWIPLSDQGFVSARGVDAGEIVTGWVHTDAPRMLLLSGAVSAALFGRAIAPFWLRGDIGALQSRKTLYLLAAILSIQFIAIPFVSQGQSVSSEFMLLGGVTFMAGLIWNRKAMFAAPLIIMLCYLIGFVAYDARGLWRLSLEMGKFGMLAFPFAFFGALIGERARMASTPEDVLRKVDITPLAKLVRDLDVSATLKAFVAVLAPLIVLGNFHKIKSLFVVIMAMDFESFESDEFLYIIIFGVAALLGAFAPLAFIVTDWLARREAGRYLSAVSGAALGLVGIVAVAQAFGASTMVAHEMEWAPFDTGRWILAGAVAIVLGLIGGRMLAESQRIRTILLGILVLLGVAVLGTAAYTTIGELKASDDLQELLGILLIATLAVIVIWYIVRGVRLRLLLSGTRPRSLFFGELRGGFWARMAFLVGLPSSMWRRTAMKKPSFWLFILSRPLVYLGAVLLVAKASQLGPTVSIGFGLALIAGGHLAFVSAKRLASRDVWRPESSAGKRSPILFLRSFDDDQLDFKRSVWDLRGRWFDLWSHRSNADEALIDEVAQYGPVVALGRPGETRAPFGALRHYSTDEDWQKVVTDAARRAQAIIIAASDSQGVQWEYELLQREGLIDRTLLLFRPRSNEAAANRRALGAFSKVQKVVEEVADGQRMVALLQTDSGPLLVTARRHMAGAYVAAIRAHFQNCAVQALYDPAGLFPVPSREPVADAGG